jgi:hypothetical protein
MLGRDEGEGREILGRDGVDGREIDGRAPEPPGRLIDGPRLIPPPPRLMPPPPRLIPPPPRLTPPPPRLIPPRAKDGLAVSNRHKQIVTAMDKYLRIMWFLQSEGASSTPPAMPRLPFVGGQATRICFVGRDVGFTLLGVRPRQHSRNHEIPIYIVCHRSILGGTSAGRLGG